MGNSTNFSAHDIKSDFGHLPRASTRKIRGRRVEWVYFVQSLAEPFRIKIGKTQNLRMRMMGLQWMCPVPLALQAAHIWPEHTEPAIHECFKDLRCHGEWFYPGDNLAEAIEALGSTPSLQEPMQILEFFAPFSSPKIEPERVYQEIYLGRADNKARKQRQMESAYSDERNGYKPKGSAKLTGYFEAPTR